MVGAADTTVGVLVVISSSSIFFLTNDDRRGDTLSDSLQVIFPQQLSEIVLRPQTLDRKRRRPDGFHATVIRHKTTEGCKAEGRCAKLQLAAENPRSPTTRFPPRRNVARPCAAFRLPPKWDRTGIGRLIRDITGRSFHSGGIQRRLERHDEVTKRAIIPLYFETFERHQSLTSNHKMQSKPKSPPKPHHWDFVGKSEAQFTLMLDIMGEV